MKGLDFEEKMLLGALIAFVVLLSVLLGLDIYAVLQKQVSTAEIRQQKLEEITHTHYSRHACYWMDETDFLRLVGGFYMPEQKGESK